jgi:ribosomal protein S18 acetylase RimI-like enzyme
MWTIPLVVLLLLVVVVDPSLGFAGVGFGKQPKSSSPPPKPLNTNNDIQIQKVTTTEDWNDLAFVRYNEWIAPDGEKSATSSLKAFSLATLEIYKEERPDAICFLAKQTSNSTVVGAAELSPMEARGALLDNNPDNGSIWYVTDVVTKVEFRRQGIALQMLEAVELEAQQQEGATHLVLHVAPDNLGALEFYQRLGYEAPPLGLLEILDTEKLAENAGTKGQILLTKAVTIQSSVPRSSNKGKQKQKGFSGAHAKADTKADKRAAVYCFKHQENHNRK